MSTSTNRRNTDLDPLKATDQPSTMKNKLVKIQQFLVDIEPDNLNKQSLKEFDQLLDNLTKKNIIQATNNLHEIKLLMACALIDLVRILSIEHNSIIARADQIFKVIIDTMRNSHQLKDHAQQNQFIYLFHTIRKTNALVLLCKDESADTARLFVLSAFELQQLFNQQESILNSLNQPILTLLEKSLTFFSDDNFQALLIIVLLCLQKENKGSFKFELSKSIINELPWGVKKPCGSLCIDLLKKKGMYTKIQPTIGPEKVIQIIYYLFKCDYEVVRSIWPYIENEINLTRKKELRKQYVLMVGKICSFKRSPIATNCPQIFNYFMEMLTAKSNKHFRKDLIEVAFKYLRNFSQCKNVSELEMSTSTIKYDVHKKNLVRIDAKLRELMKDNDEDTRGAIFDSIHQCAFQDPYIISQNLLKDLTNRLWDEKEPKKLSILIILIDIYNKYVGSLFEEGIFDLEDQSGFKLVNGSIDTSIVDRKEIAKQFQWIVESIVVFQYSTKKNEFVLLSEAFSRLFAIEKCDSQLIARHFLGVFFNVWRSKYKENQLVDDKDLHYDDFIHYILKYNWYEDSDIKFPQFNFLLKGLQKILKISIKLVNNFQGYIHCLLNDEPAKKDDYLSYLTTYIIPSAKAEEVENELIRLLKNKEFRQNVEIAVGISNIEGTLKSQMNALGEVFKRISSKELYVAFNLFSMHPFTSQGYNALADEIYAIIAKDGGLNSSIFLKEGSIELLNLILKQDSRGLLEVNIQELSSYLIEQVDRVVTKRDDKTSNKFRKDIKVISNLAEKRADISTISYGAGCLKLLSLINLQELSNQNELIDLEDFKNHLGELILKLTLPRRQAKFGSRIIVKIDKFTSEKISTKLIDKLINHLDVKSSHLHTCVKSIVELLKSDYDMFIHFMNHLDSFFYKLIEIPTSQISQNIISELSQTKKHLMKTLYKSYFATDQVIVNETYKVNSSRFKSFLLELLLNFNQICSGSNKADQDYLRVNALIYLLEILAHENSIEVHPEIYAKLSLLCFDDSDDIKRVLFSQVFTKKNRKRNHLPNQFFLYSVFLHFTSYENLRFITESVFTQEFFVLQEEYLDQIKLNQKEDINKSPEYMLTYLIFLMCNNPLLLLNAKNIPPYVTKCLDFFIHNINKKPNPNRGEYFMNILYKMKDCEPLIFDECGTTTMDFTEIKVKKTIRKFNIQEQEQPKVLSFKEIIEFIIRYVKEIYGTKAIFSKRLPVTLPNRLYKSRTGSFASFIPLSNFKEERKLLLTDEHGEIVKSNLKSSKQKNSTNKELLNTKPKIIDEIEDFDDLNMADEDSHIKKLDFQDEEVRREEFDEEVDNGDNTQNSQQAEKRETTRSRRKRGQGKSHNRNKSDNRGRSSAANGKAAKKSNKKTLQDEDDDDDDNDGKKAEVLEIISSKDKIKKPVKSRKTKGAKSKTNRSRSRSRSSSQMKDESNKSGKSKKVDDQRQIRKIASAKTKKNKKRSKSEAASDKKQKDNDVSVVDKKSSQKAGKKRSKSSPRESPKTKPKKKAASTKSRNKTKRADSMKEEGEVEKSKKVKKTKK